MAQEDEKIKRVGYYTTSANTQTTIKVYRKVKDLPDDGQLLATRTNEDTYAGYHTAELGEDICIGKDEKFSIVISQKNIYDKDIECYAVTDSEDAWLEMIDEAPPGQSFLWEKGRWEDLYINDEEHHTAPVKAYASATKAEDNSYEPQETSIPEFDPENPGQLTLTFKRKVLDDLTFERFEDAFVDGRKLVRDKGDGNGEYDASSGSLIINLYENCLKTLKSGEHTLKVSFIDGENTSVNFRVLKEKERYIPPVTGIE